MTNRNTDVRRAINEAREKNIKQWMIAEKFGVSDSRFSVLLRQELSKTAKNRIFAIIKDLEEELADELPEVV
ncbi:MAG: hypothetical protein CVU89_03375 [Firmicutes bacterium HGW-Firmicutes-14]|nr:MAG: hypothetical protein CVU89_03375 [Firmicutes bacterium HGW-Firmicutes-14]